MATKPTKPTIDFEASLHEGGMPVTEEQARAEFDTIVKQEGLITNTSKMSPFWRLITAIVTAPVMWLKDILVTAVMPSMYLATASGVFVDLFAWALNLERKKASATVGLITFIKTDSSVAITIPAGTLIQTERINDKVYAVAVNSDTVIPAGIASLDIATTATKPGTAYNLAPGYYRILPKEISGIASVENRDNWLSTPGADVESDDDLRDRCRNQYNLVGSYHVDAVYRGMIAAVAGLSTDRIFFEHDAPRGPGTANAFLLLDTGVPSASFVEKVNDHINGQGYHGHGDDMQCFPIPETQHNLTVHAWYFSTLNLDDDEQAVLKNKITDVVRCAFRDNADYQVSKTWPHSRFSFSRLGEELHLLLPELESVVFSLPDIISGLNIPRLDALSVELTSG
ncbi:baseplate J/gp47 family protein [Serratia sp. root2]|uniref:baseplate J/gp47 family protein n=1 Tax=Serratia sp. root2 TaxID=3059676 RepID=UPI00288EE802|nr:baseplate J/gp47 family protein [Serratia sp. root2]MDT3252749.1 baseplate J/gp47 family protein [Serratia sp. root2]